MTRILANIQIPKMTSINPQAAGSRQQQRVASSRAAEGLLHTCLVLVREKGKTG